MNRLDSIEQDIMVNPNHLKYLKFEMDKGMYIVTLNDLSGYDIVSGYGKTIIEAINDLHRGLI